MEQKRPNCVVTLYDEEAKTICTFNVSRAAIADVLAKATSFDVPLADFDYRVDDEFARKVGAMSLLLLAGRSEFLKNHLSITTEESGDSGNEPPGEDGDKKRSWWKRK